MTINDLQRASLATFAIRSAGERGSLEQMKSICYCIRNRVRAGWNGGNWISVIENADEFEGNEVTHPVKVDPDSANVSRLIRDIDDIYFGVSANGKDGVTAQDFSPNGGDLEQAIGKCVMWCFLDRPMSEWFVKYVIHDPKNHPQKTQMGTMLFFE